MCNRTFHQRLCLLKLHKMRTIIGIEIAQKHAHISFFKCTFQQRLFLLKLHKMRTTVGNPANTSDNRWWTVTHFPAVVFGQIAQKHAHIFFPKCTFQQRFFLVNSAKITHKKNKTNPKNNLCLNVTTHNSHTSLTKTHIFQRTLTQEVLA